MKQRMGAHEVVATLLLLGPKLETIASNMYDYVQSQKVTPTRQCQGSSPTMDYSASKVEEKGIIVRLVGNDTESVRQVIQTLLEPLDKMYNMFKYKQTWNQ